MRGIRKIIAVSAIVLLLAAAVLWQIPKARCFQLVGEVTCRLKTDAKLVALTFDDGPTPEGVDAVLAELGPRGISATFFLIGNRMEKFPGQAERLIAAGHELGNHTYSHERNIGRSQDFYAAEIARTDVLLKRAGSDTNLFRPPFGKRLIGLPLEVERAGYRTIMWDVEEQPEKFTEPGAFAQDILDRIRPGSIILIHPMYRHNQVARAALPMVLDGLAAQGYEVVTVSELLERTGPGS
ncbi:MAG: polysaccharide deacetylase [Sphingomonadales bacterium]|nr:MAG: polysaccharide deacetylase [Sphingomonadales bacterium]